MYERDVKKSDERELKASNITRPILSRHASARNGRPSTTPRPRRPLVGDPEDPNELYSFSMSDIKASEHRKDEEEENCKLRRPLTFHS